MDPRTAEDALDVEFTWKQVYGGQWREHDAAGRAPPEGRRAELRFMVRCLWKYAMNWATLVELNRRYLLRRLPVCGSYYDPPDSETDDFNNLLRLHDYGLLSTNSCPGWILDDERQRAFLYFSIPTHDLTTIRSTNTSRAVRQFLERLLSSRDVRTVIRFAYDNPPAGVQRAPEIEAFMPDGSRHNIPPNTQDEYREEGWHGPLRTYRFLFEHRLTRKNLEQDWDDDRYCYGISHSGSAFRDDAPGAIPLHGSWRADPLQVYVVARDWNYRGIGALIEELLIDVGILPAFPPHYR